MYGSKKPMMKAKQMKASKKEATKKGGKMTMAKKAKKK